ncbi:hypothetical protein D3C76_1188170 [compost metagenome]
MRVVLQEAHQIRPNESAKRTDGVDESNTTSGSLATQKLRRQRIEDCLRRNRTHQGQGDARQRWNQRVHVHCENKCQASQNQGNNQIQDTAPASVYMLGPEQQANG